MFLVLGALHDLSRGDRSPVEFTALTVGVLACTAILWIVRKSIYYVGTATALLILLQFAALQSWKHPKYPSDSVVAGSFLLATLPLLLALLRQLLCLARRAKRSATF